MLHLNSGHQTAAPYSLQTNEGSDSLWAHSLSPLPEGLIKSQGWPAVEKVTSGWCRPGPMSWERFGARKHRLRMAGHISYEPLDKSLKVFCTSLPIYETVI